MKYSELLSATLELTRVDVGKKLGRLDRCLISGGNNTFTTYKADHTVPFQVPSC